MELTKKVNSTESVSKIIANMEDSKTISSKKSQHQREKSSIELEERLMKFNERLQNCIQDN